MTSPRSEAVSAEMASSAIARVVGIVSVTMNFSFVIAIGCLELFRKESSRETWWHRNSRARGNIAVSLPSRLKLPLHRLVNW